MSKPLRRVVFAAVACLVFVGCNCTTPAGTPSDGGGSRDGGGGAGDGGVTGDGGASGDGGLGDGGGGTGDGGSGDGGGGTGDGGSIDGGGGTGDGGSIDGGSSAGLNCAYRCHGDDLTAAPPWDTLAGALTDAVGVGAHRSHLGVGSDWHRDVLCEDCHRVPVQVGDVGHLDTPLPAELTWGSVATSDGAAPAWDRLQCSGVYCHGATLHPGGTNIAPAWTTVDGSQALCGTCHSLPPQAPHPSNTDCSSCHPTIADDDTTFLEPQRHIDGIVDLGPLACTTCHGDALVGPAPPVDTSGGSATTLTGVGAHQSHLATGSGWHRDVVCTDCHLYPATYDAPGHIDTPLPAELTWGAVPTADAAIPTWSGGSCDNYCHGQTLLPGGSNTTPSWTTVDNTQAACGTCHGTPPGGSHPVAPAGDCSGCHPFAGTTPLDPATHVDGIVDLTLACNSCHGSAVNDAPPQDTLGNLNTANAGVGAHQSHVAGDTSWHRAVLCDDCHQVPTAVGDIGHRDTPLPAELNWGALPQADGATVSYVGGTCTNYCHGDSLIAGGTNTTPDWTTVDNTQAACGTCHGTPPGLPHPGNTDCSSCHPTMNADDVTFATPAQHVDGIVDLVSPLACNSCHGSVTNDAPPQDTTGNTATTDAGVGAHQSHMDGDTSWHAPIDCSECHVVPAVYTDAGHADSALPAELTWGTTAEADGAVADYTGGTCTNYCHGQTLEPGGSNTTPDWTTVNDTQAACGTCHGTPPGGTHPANPDCSSCHPTMNADDVTFADPTRHVDGTVDLVPLACNTCHGSVTNDAPPRDTTGNLLTTDTGVGAHQSHVDGDTSWHRAVVCTDCHVVPLTMDDVGHRDTPLPAELTWDLVPRADGAIPGWDGASCTNYCHGQTLLSGGSNTTPNWTTVDTTQAACGTCHGTPPDFPHVGRTDCESCHPNAGAGQTFTQPDRHVDGTVDLVPLACNTCHGSVTNDAPPVDTQGGSADTLTSVGAHQSHIDGDTTWHRAVVCTDCHQVPAAVADAGHIDTTLPAELSWGAVPLADGAVPGWDGASCDNYCHGQTLEPGGSNTTPVWTTVNDTQAACGTCHGTPPGGIHPPSTDCSSCHPTMNADDVTFASPAQHVDGTVDVSVACNSCHGSATSDAPPVDTQGGSANTLTSVGAHQEHLATGSTWRADIACTECHLVPAVYTDAGHRDGDGTAELTWGPRAGADGAPTTWDGTSCANYCHGATLPGGADTTPEWTVVNGTQAECGDCHSIPPPGPHPAAAPTDCAPCHPFTGTVPDDPQTHVDGTLDLLCGSCHGYPPTPADQDYPGGGGAHDRHFSTLGFECATCHGHNGSGPTHDQGGGTVLQANVDVVFAATPVYPGGTTPTNGLSPTHTKSANPTCRNGCHDPQPGDVAELTNDAVWTDTTISCAECHDEPGITSPVSHDLDPSATGDDLVVRASCEECHDIATHTAGTVLIRDPDPADGFSFAATGLSGLCRTCHDGSAGPFFDGQSPKDQSSYWTIPCEHSVQGFDCADCHDRHGSAAGTVLVNREETLCYGCHDGTVATTDLTVPFGRASRHPIVDGEQTDQEVECHSCHEVHVLTTGTHVAGSSVAAPVLYGSTGMEPQTVGGAGTSPSNYQPLVLAGNVTDLEAFLCFKCHTNARPAYAGVDVGRDFNPNNPRYHAVWGASKATGWGTYTGGWNANSDMACSDCHRSASGADPAGAHGSAQGGLLRGLWNQNTGTPGNVTGHVCFNCHSPTVYGANCTNENGNASGFREAGDRNLHCRRHDDRPCAACHGMVPHGWTRPYPLVTDQDGPPYSYPNPGFGLSNDSNMGNWGPTQAWDENDCHNQVGGCG